VKIWQKLERIEVVLHFENLLFRHAHAVIRLYSLFSEVYGSGGPMGIIVVHRYQNDIFGEDVNLMGG